MILLGGRQGTRIRMVTEMSDVGHPGAAGPRVPVARAKRRPRRRQWAGSSIQRLGPKDGGTVSEQNLLGEPVARVWDPLGVHLDRDAPAPLSLRGDGGGA